MNSQLATYKNNSYMVRKTKQVVMLYEGAIRSVQQAKAAIEEGDIETRFNALTKACEIVRCAKFTAAVAHLDPTTHHYD